MMPALRFLCYRFACPSSEPLLGRLSIRLIVITSISWTLLAGASAAQPSPQQIGLSPGFLVDRAGVITSTPGEVLAGQRSIKGGNSSGDRSYTAYLRTNTEQIVFGSGREYEVTFRYTIVETPDRGFETIFLSPTGAAAGNFLPGVFITGAAGSTGVATFTNTLGNYGDYQVVWNIVGRGAIVVDDIRITEQRTSETVAAEDAEGTGPRLRLVQAFLPSARLGRSFAAMVAASGGQPPYAWRAGVLDLPPGIQLSATGELHGTPTAVGTYTFDLVVRDGTGASARLPVRLAVVPSVMAPAPQPLRIEDGIATVRPAEYVLPFRNPLAGMRAAMDTANRHPFATLARHYIEWNLLENSEHDTVEKIRDVTDRLFGELPAYNIKAVPRVYLVWPDPLAKHWPADLRPDDYTSPEFLRRLRRLITRLGEVWDTDPRIAYVETGIIGYWGEQHTPGFASLPPEVEREFGAAFREAFPNKLLMNRYPRDLAEQPFGIHWDIFGAFRGDAGNGTDAIVKELESPPHADRWKIAPRGGEVDPTFLDEPAFTDAARQTVVRKHTPRLTGLIRRLHWNHLEVVGSIPPDDQELWSKAGEIQNALGYRFVIREASYTAELSRDRPLGLDVTLENVGSSPFYYPWPLEIALLDSSTRQPVWRTTWPGVDLRSWLPGETVRLRGEFPVSAGLRDGHYVVALAILDPAGMVPAARFANVNYWTGGRTPLGPASVGTAAPSLELGDFDDLQADRSLHYVP